MNVPKFTVVLGLDACTLPYFATTCPSWKRFYPELWDAPWCVFYDPSQITADEIKVASLDASVRLVPWNGSQAGYESQRAKMLSGHVFISRMIETDYFLKIDADAIAVSRGEWPMAEWFVDRPVLVGPGWGYWRAKGSTMSLVEWCQVLEDFGTRHFGTEPQGWEGRIGSWNHVKGPKLRDKNRFVSWLGFQRADWVRTMADLFEADFGQGRLPVPSHDTSLWACAVRSDALTRVISVKPSWTNRVTLRGCKREMEKLNE